MFKPGDKVEFKHKFKKLDIYTIKTISTESTYSPIVTLEELNSRYWANDLQLAYPKIFNDKLEEILE